MTTMQVSPESSVLSKPHTARISPFGFFVVLLFSYQGICESCAAVLGNTSALYANWWIALATFIIVPVGALAAMLFLIFRCFVCNKPNGPPIRYDVDAKPHPRWKHTQYGQIVAFLQR